MASTNNSNPEKVTFFKNLLNRRVPQIVGIYLGGSWGIVQFIDWLVNRYLLSPHLVEVAFVILITLVPSILIMAYFHGMPGRNRWRNIEKISIPVNIGFSIILVLFIFVGKDFGSISQKVTLKDETGQTIERVIPKAEYKKKIALFYFDNTSADPSLDWLQYGIIDMIAFDLEQDLFLDILSPEELGLKSLDYYVLNKIKEAGYKKAVGLPLLLKRKITAEFNKDYFLSGKISKEKDDLILDLSLYRAKDAKLLANTSFGCKDQDIFQQVDHMTVWIKKALGIPSGHIETVNDLPLAETFTRSLPAARSFSLASKAITFDNDYSTAEKYLNASLQEDPSFTLASVQLAAVYMMSNQSEKIPPIFETIMQQLFKLPERNQFYIKCLYYATKQDTAKQIAVLRMMIKLYPQDIRAFSFLAVILESNQQYDEAIALYKQILEIDSRRYEVLEFLGKLYEKKGDLQQALTYFQKYAEHFPENPQSFISIGNLYKKKRDNHLAKEQYEKALLLEPNNISVSINLADIELISGNLARAEQQYQETFKRSKIPKYKAAIYEKLADLCEIKGQMKKALEYRQAQLTFAKEFMPPLLVSINTIFTMSNYIQAGKEQEAISTLETLKQELPPPYDKNIDFGYLMIYLESERADEIEKLLPKIEEIIRHSGAKNSLYFVHLARGRIHQLREEYAEANLCFQKALEIIPADEELLVRIGQCSRKLKQYEKAEKALQNALKSNPFHPKFNYELALLYQDIGNKQGALKHVKVAMEAWKDADEDYKPARSAILILEKIKKK